MITQERIGWCMRLHAALREAGCEGEYEDTDGTDAGLQWKQAAGQSAEQVALAQQIIAAFPLADARAQKRAAINAERVRREQSGFSYGGKVFDSDQNAYNRITAAAQAAMASILVQQAFPSIDWTCADNSTMTLNAQGVLAMQEALVSRGLALHAAAATIKATLDACATVEEIAALDITQGWPK